MSDKKYQAAPSKASPKTPSKTPNGYTDEAPDVIRGRFQGRWVHAEGTSMHKATTSWLGKWRTVTGQDAQQCCFVAEDCASQNQSPATLGAHVRWSGSTKRFASLYIVPACAACNAQHGRAGRLKPDTTLVKVVQGRVLRPNVLLSGRVSDEANFRMRLWRKPRKDQPPVARVWPADWTCCF